MRLSLLSAARNSRAMRTFHLALLVACSASPLQPAHPFHQVPLGSFHRQVVMITHDHIGVEQPAALWAGLKKCLFKGAGTPILKKLLTVIASADHMVDASGKLQPRFPRHLARPAASWPKVNMYFIGLTPSLPPNFTHTTVSLVLMPAVTGSERAVSHAQLRAAL